MSRSKKNLSIAVQYNACLAITGAIRGTSREHLYRELGLEILNNRRWSGKLFSFHKITKGFSLSYLQKVSYFRDVQHYQTRSKSTKIIEKTKARTKAFENSFFPDCINEWLKLSDEI